jgi:transposase InsO family protein
MNVVDRHSKLLYLGACNTNISAEGAAHLFLETAWQYEGLPRQIISDRGPQFAAVFTKELNRLLWIKGSLTTAYHPQSDGQTERVNQEMEIYLRIFINHYQNDWTQWLPLATFSWNAWINPTTHRSPFEAAHGRQPRMGMEPTRKHSDGRLQNANDVVEKMKEVKQETESALKAAAEDMKRFYDAKRQPDKFEVGDEVWLNAKDLTTEQPSKKLDYKCLGPFPIVRKVSELAYELKLPRSFKIHPVISASRLEKVKPDEWNRPRPRVTLKVRDPQSGEFINRTRQSPPIFKLPPSTFAAIPFKPMPDPFFEDDILPVKVDRGRPTLEGELISENFLDHLIATGQFHNGN